MLRGSFPEGTVLEVHIEDGRARFDRIDTPESEPAEPAAVTETEGGES